MDMPETIAAERLSLERPHPATPELAEELFAAIDRSRATLRVWLPWLDAIASPEDELRFLAGPCEKAWEDKRSFAYAIRLSRTGRLAGVVSLEGVSEKNRSAEIGYWLDDAHTGFGYMREAVRALERAAFDAGLNRLVIRNDTRNARSVAVAVRAGYRLEGVLRQERRDPFTGTFNDTNVFAKLKAES